MVGDIPQQPLAGSVSRAIAEENPRVASSLTEVSGSLFADSLTRAPVSGHDGPAARRLFKSSVLIAALIGVCFLAGCGNLIRLAADIKETGNKIRLVSGSMATPVRADREVIVVVLGDDQGNEIHNYRVFERDGAFRIAALRDSHFLFAFQDVNRDFSYQANEPATWFDLKEAGIQSGDVSEVRLVLSGPTDRPAPLRMTNLFDLRGSSLGQIDVQLGKTASLDDARFSEQSADMGMWEPIGFMKAGHAGIFFLEPYDTARTPVLFVHGINGSPRDFSDLIASIDRRRYQSWLFNYPSGLDLRALGDGLVGLLAELRHQHGFRKLHIVAHSMGGLLIREYLAECARSRSCDYMGNFVSVSTPFGGVASAGWWLDYARVVMPVWRNLVPDGPFLRDLFDQSLPVGVSHHLLFSYRNVATLSRSSGDGVIPLESQLRPEVQREASLVRGFNEDHMSILRNKDLHRYVNEAFSSAPGNSGASPEAGSRPPSPLPRVQ